MARRSSSFVNKGSVLMHLSIARGNRNLAAKSAEVSERTFRRWMSSCRVKAPRSDIKLSMGMVQSIRDRSGELSRSELARAAGVCERTIDQVLDYETWRGV